MTKNSALQEAIDRVKGNIIARKLVCGKNTEMVIALETLITYAETAEKRIAELEAKDNKPAIRSWSYFCQMFGLHPNSHEYWEKMYPNGMLIKGDE